MMNEDLAPRPLALDIAATPQAEVGGWIFKELGKVKRQIDPRADKWRRGGWCRRGHRSPEFRAAARAQAVWLRDPDRTGIVTDALSPILPTGTQ